MGERLYPNVKKITNTFCLALVILTAALFVLRLTALSGMIKDDAPSEPEPEEVIIDGNTINYRIRTDIEFPSPSEKGNITIENDASNDFYLRVEIIYDISGKSVYLSPFLKPGDRIDSDYLHGERLPRGEYKCTATITAYDPDTRAELKSHKQPVTIKVMSQE